MKWQLQYGKYEKFFEKRSAKGHHVEALATRPELFPDLQPIYEAFWELCRFRPRSGFAISTIQLTDIISWLDLYEVNDPELRQYYFRMIAHLDHVMMQWHEERSEKEKTDANRSSRH